ncbi:hypothetical protein BYT27DRAFT_7162045, partial [Phlegmacium glaucopus]
EIFVYKNIANRVKPVATTLPEKDRIIRNTPSNPLSKLPILPISPPEIPPGIRCTLEQKELIPVNKNQFLKPEREKLGHRLIKIHETTWNKAEKGKLSEEYFEPADVPTIEHVPRVLRNSTVLPGIYGGITKIIKWPKLKERLLKSWLTRESTFVVPWRCKEWKLFRRVFRKRIPF